MNHMAELSDEDFKQLSNSYLKITYSFRTYGNIETFSK